MEALLKLYLQTLADREDLPEETRKYVEEKLKEDDTDTATT